MVQSYFTLPKRPISPKKEFVLGKTINLILIYPWSGFIVMTIWQWCRFCIQNCPFATKKSFFLDLKFFVVEKLRTSWSINCSGLLFKRQRNSLDFQKTSNNRKAINISIVVFIQCNTVNLFGSLSQVAAMY